jgi:hypothetical protein
MNWWHILYESEGEVLDRSSEEFQRRHNLLHAGDGYFYPSLLFLSGGDGDEGVTELQVDARRTELRRYIPDTLGPVPVSTTELKNTLADFVNTVIARLEDQGVSDTELQREWQLIETMDLEASEFSRYVATAGLDPNDIDQETADRVAGLAESVPRDEWDTLFSNAESRIELLEQGKEAIERHRAELATTDYEVDVARNLRYILSKPVGVRPWQSGYELARAVRSELDIEQVLFGSLESLQRVFGIEDQALQALVRRHDIPYDALVGVNPTGSPGIVMNGVGSGTSRQAFLFCRAMGEYLGSTVDAEYIISKAKTMRQKRNRAFAAEFLAPSALLRQHVHKAIVGGVDVEDLADRFGVSEMVIIHQLENHAIAHVEPL